MMVVSDCTFINLDLLPGKVTMEYCIFIDCAVNRQQAAESEHVHSWSRK